VQAVNGSYLSMTPMAYATCTITMYKPFTEVRCLVLALTRVTNTLRPAVGAGGRPSMIAARLVLTRRPLRLPVAQAMLSASPLMRHVASVATNGGARFGLGPALRFALRRRVGRG
jgi:hypothetical protein